MQRYECACARACGCGCACACVRGHVRVRVLVRVCARARMCLSVSVGALVHPCKRATQQARSVPLRVDCWKAGLEMGSHARPRRGPSRRAHALLTAHRECEMPCSTSVHGIDSADPRERAPQGTCTDRPLCRACAYCPPAARCPTHLRRTRTLSISLFHSRLSNPGEITDRQSAFGQQTLQKEARVVLPIGHREAGSLTAGGGSVAK